MLVDTRGMRCPWPVIRLARAMRSVAQGEAVRLLADDPAAPGEVSALVAERGWTVDRTEVVDGLDWVIVKI
ncbi:sulfurtransferase TusA family protein [Flavisphingomonas formosensis]|uniref:sulfurtransferase TusA family protein n=1 Tax=Flavisphingomonas formosensis TaxID=861534 RepID=UPI0012F9D41B|nr:sulfurtransferase TusA family protein [Sphingomonas formosensis]